MQEIPYISRDEWEPIGFEGDPEDGVNFAWILVQQNLNFHGPKSTLSQCELYYSSTKKYLFLVSPKSFRPCIWNIKDLNFNYFPQSEDFLEIRAESRHVHLSSVSPNFTQLLVQYQKIPHSQFSPPNISQVIEYESSTGISQSTRSSSVGSSYQAATGSLSDLHVILTESDKNRTRLAGKLTVTDTAFKVVGESRIDIKFADITRIQKIFMLSTFILIFLKDGRRFELSFKNQNDADVELFYQTVEKQLEK